MIRFDLLRPARRAWLAELARVEAQIGAAYWRFTRCARAAPPSSVVPEAYARRAELRRLLWSAP